MKKWAIYNAVCTLVGADSLTESSSLPYSWDHQLGKANADWHDFCGFYHLIWKTFVKIVVRGKKEQDIIPKGYDRVSP